jgi:hypothetical protein
MCRQCGQRLGHADTADLIEPHVAAGDDVILRPNNNDVKVGSIA